MKRERLFSATEIAEILCDADDLDLSEHEDTHNRIRYITKRTFRDESGAERPLLLNGHQIDARGKRAYPALEVYRAAVFNDLMALSIDVRALQAVIDAASREHPANSPQVRPASMRTDGGWRSLGGLRDAIRGVAQGEDWILILHHYHGGHSGKGGIAAQFLPLIEGRDWQAGQAESDEIFGARRTRTFVQIDLSELFGPIIEQIGVA